MNLWPQETFTSYVRDVPADAGFVYHKAATLGDKIKVDTKQNTVTYRNHPSPTNGMAPPPPQKKTVVGKIKALWEIRGYKKSVNIHQRIIKWYVPSVNTQKHLDTSIKCSKNKHRITINLEAIKLVSYAIINLSLANEDRFV